MTVISRIWILLVTHFAWCYLLAFCTQKDITSHETPQYVKKLEIKIEKQSQLIENQGALIKTLTERLDSFDSKLQSLKDKNNGASTSDTTHMPSMMANVSLSQPKTNASLSTIPPRGVHYQHSSSGCLYDILQLNCESGLINVTFAEYGQYGLQCTEQCCQPHPADDCVESVEENREQDWLYLKFVCDNKPTCDFEYQGSVLYTCPRQEIAEYMKIYYACFPELIDQPVAFTAYTSSDREYVDGEMIKFEGVVSNIGRFYDPTSSTFICPYDGLYMFSINIMSFADRFIYAKLLKDNEVLVTAQADDSANVYTQASNLVFTECIAGQTVWVEAEACCGRLYSTNNRYSTFSGALIKRIDE